jgi:hypothetical protein
MIFARKIYAAFRWLLLLNILTAPLLPARALVSNGGFELGGRDWSLFVPDSARTTQPELLIVTGGAREGKAHLRLFSASSARFAAAHDPLTVEGGLRYRLRVWVRAAPDVDYAVGPLIRVIFSEASPSKADTSLYVDVEGRVSLGVSPTLPRPVSLPSEWRKIEAVIEAPERSVIVRPALFAWRTRGSVDFDDFTMEKVSASTPLTELSVDKSKLERDKLSPLSAERVRDVTAWLSPKPENVAPPWTDRAYWENVGRLPAAPGLLENAAKLLGTEPPVLTEELFNEYRVVGLRRSYELPNGDRTNRLVTLVLAECISPDQSRLDQIVREVHGILDEPTWVVPAHASRFPDWHAAREFIDLAASARGWTLANIDWLLAERLPAATRQRIRKEVGERILTPWITRIREGNVGTLWWMKAPMNWSAVCNAGVLGSALLLIDNPKERAEYIVAWEQLNRYFLSGFTADGYCAEGVAYWGYGFGHFVMASELVKRVSGGRIDTLDTEQARTIMAYGPSFEIANRYYPPFSDTTLGSRPDQHILDFAAVRFGLGKVFGPPTLKGFSILGGRIHVALFDLATDRASVRETGRASLPLRSWFPHGGALICRGADADRGLAVAIKGGHNDEPHNHNDLGTFVVVSDGRVALSEIGKDDYTDKTFGELRYTSSVMNSFGHAVPRVAGKLQSTGAQARAVTVRSEFTPARDLWEIDLTSAYTVPDLIKVTRTFIYDRAESGSLEIIDQASYRSPQAFGVAFVLLPTQRWVEDGKGGFLVEGGDGRVHVSVTSETGLVRSEDLITGILPGAAPKGLRVGFDLAAPATSVRIRTLITSAPAIP